MGQGAAQDEFGLVGDLVADEFPYSCDALAVRVGGRTGGMGSPGNLRGPVHSAGGASTAFAIDRAARS